MKALFSLSHNAIPVMGFERDFMTTTGLTLDQTRFALAFLGAVTSGLIVRCIRSTTGECANASLLLLLLPRVA
jgi:hypothetical protein